MSETSDDASARLEFFDSAILHPAARESVRFKDRTICQIGLMEAALWARLGVELGYLDRAVIETLNGHGLWESFLSLREVQIISPQNSWGNIFVEEGENQGRLNEELFRFERDEENPQVLRLLQTTYETLLLLASENMFNSDTSFFLESISWRSDAVWIALWQGGNTPVVGSAGRIGSGFANVLTYWEELASIARYPIFLSFLNEPRPWMSIPELIGKAAAITVPSFGLSRTETISRYFMLAGEFVHRGKDNSTRWFDARQKVFENLFWQITTIGGGHYFVDEKEHFWNVFSNGVEDAQSKTEEIRPSERFRAREDGETL